VERLTEISSLCGLAILVPPIASRSINRWRREYDPSYPALAPHLTLAYPPFVPPNEWETIRGDCAAQLSRFSPFNITLSGVGTFLSPWRVLWLKPDEESKLKRLRNALEKRLPTQIPVFPVAYQPHVTIGLFPDEESLAAARDRVSEEFKPITFLVQTVDYLVQDTDGIWRVYDRLPLLGKRSPINRKVKSPLP
jgi:2'-5' RNA ligase